MNLLCRIKPGQWWPLQVIREYCILSPIVINNLKSEKKISTFVAILGFIVYLITCEITEPRSLGIVMCVVQCLI